MLSSDNFYSLFAPSYGEYACKRKTYLDAVDALVSKEIPLHASSLVDMGAGDGRRALQIAASSGISDITLIDNSPGMRSLVPVEAKARLLCADITENIIDESISGDVVLCLWNVLGHIPKSGLHKALINMRAFMKENGVAFVDVNNRHNIAQYGLGAAKNYVHDVVSNSGGDFPLTIEAGGESVSTNVHIFSKREIETAFKNAGLVIENRVYIDYKTGVRKHTQFGGQLAYKLRKA